MFVLSVPHIFQEMNDTFSNPTHDIGATRLLAAAGTFSESFLDGTAVKFTYERAMALEIGIAIALVYATFSLI